MTLIIAAGNPDQFIQVSDRRLTSNGVVQCDESNKAIVLNCANARLSIGFTGLAKIGSFRTRDWLLKSINECGPPDYTAENIVRRFTQRASKDFRGLSHLKRARSSDKRLSIMFTGYLYHHEPPLGALALVSNFHNLDDGKELAEARDEFDCFFREEHRPNDGRITLIHTIGVIHGFSRQDSSKIVDLVRTRKPARAIVGKLVESIQEFSRSPKSNNLVGRQLNSIVLPRDRTQNAESGYHSDMVTSESYMPDQIFVESEKLHMNVSDVSIQPMKPETSSPIAGPKLHPNQRCWCGSGKKYRQCHGRPSSKKMGTWGLKFRPDE